MKNKTKKSNREGTGKKHPCSYCSKSIPLYKKYCNRECYNKSKNITLICKNCQKSFTVPKNKNERKFCSIQCSNSFIDRKKSKTKAVETLKEKYNTDNPFKVKGYDNLKIDIETRNKNIKKSWDNKSHSEKKEIKEKISDTLSSKQNQEKKKIKEKRENTNIKKYGVKNTLSKNSPLREKADINNGKSFINKINSWLENNNLILMDEYRGVKDKNGDIIYYTFKHIPSGNIFKDHIACGRFPHYRDPKSNQGTSDQEKELRDFVKKLLPNNKIIFNSRHLVKGVEIDIFIPEYKIAIEYNGIYWHSEKNGKTSKYHLHKTESCENQNIQLIHIFEDEWVNKKEIVKSRLKSILCKVSNKIYARKCEVREISNKEKNSFLNENHIQGEDKSFIKLGLFYKNELTALITFGKLRKITGNIHEKNKHELIRFSSKIDTTVVGGFSKLLKYFIKNYNPTHIVSYADRRWSMGKLYEKNGFTFNHNTPPNYWYMKHYKTREHRYKYRKSELPKILENYNNGLSEWDNMKLNKYDRIWDCGSKKYTLII